MIYIQNDRLPVPKSSVPVKQEKRGGISISEAAKFLAYR